MFKDPVILAALILILAYSVMLLIRVIFSRHPLPWYDYFRGVGASLFWLGYWVAGIQIEFNLPPKIHWQLMIVGVAILFIPSMIRMSTFADSPHEPTHVLDDNPEGK